MHSITFYPLGNADCCMIDLDCGKKMLFDFRNFDSAESDEDPKFHLAETLKENLKNANREDFDVVAFTHADEDHVCGASEFFYLEHAKKYQDDDRIKIKELWVPAAMIIEKGVTNDARILRAEARHRLKEGKGIRIFSKPDKLKEWLENQDDQEIDWEKRKHLVTDAGKLVPGFSLEDDGVEFFVHSPFAAESDGETIDRNKASLILHATFEYENQQRKLLFVGDTEWEVLKDIVEITKKKGNEDRLEWDIYKIPHHCSYRALNSEKGEEKTEPIGEIKWLLDQGNNYGNMVSSSNPIPDDDENSDPPHRQAANCYKEYANNIKGELTITMEHPSKEEPTPIILTIDTSGVKLKRKTITSSSLYLTSSKSNRVG